MGGAAAVAICDVVSVRADDQATIRFAFPGPPSSLTLTQGLQPWAAQIEKDSQGTLHIEFVTGGRLATLGTTYDRLASGVFDAGFGTQASTPGKFPKTEVVALPLLVPSAKVGSRGLASLFSDNLIADEYKDVKVLGIFTFTPDLLHFKAPIETTKSMQGMKIGTATAPIADFISQLGAQPVSVAPTEIYQAMSQHLIEGFATPFTGFTQFKLQEVASFHLDAPISAQAGYVLMNKQFFDRLPEVARKALDQNAGLVFGDQMGAAMDSTAAIQRSQVSAAAGQTFGKLSDADSGAWRDIADKLASAWVKGVPGGAAILSAIKASIAKN
jgi:TRAP-type C4-dicarboxylate transport system substrate-binding protein